MSALGIALCILWGAFAGGCIGFAIGYRKGFDEGYTEGRRDELREIIRVEQERFDKGQSIGHLAGEIFGAGFMQPEAKCKRPDCALCRQVLAQRPTQPGGEA